MLNFALFKEDYPPKNGMLRAIWCVGLNKNWRRKKRKEKESRKIIEHFLERKRAMDWTRRCYDPRFHNKNISHKVKVINELSRTNLTGKQKFGMLGLQVRTSSGTIKKTECIIEFPLNLYIYTCTYKCTKN